MQVTGAALKGLALKHICNATLQHLIYKIISEVSYGSNERVYIGILLVKLAEFWHFPFAVALLHKSREGFIS